MKGEKVGVVGSGLIGRSWAMLFVGAGYNVSLYDVNSAQLEAAKKDIDAQLHSLHKEGLLRSNIPPAEQFALISTTTDLAECLRGAVYVQECVWEDKQLKHQVFQQLDGVAKEGQVLASSTSTIPGSEFTADMKHRSQCIVAHPVNPPFYCPVVELVPTPWTEPGVVTKADAIMKEIGQVPVKLKKEVVGFALNRLQYALLAECWRLVKDDIVSVEDLDKVMSEGLGMRYAFLGPMEVTHLNAEGVEEYCHKYNKAYLKVCDSMGPVPSWEEPALLEEVRKQLEAKVPPDQLQERRRWRDLRLAALAKLKREMNQQHP